ncbi:MAG: hypothetical protein AB7P21_17470 [Lautropia sp.]
MSFPARLLLAVGIAGGLTVFTASTRLGGPFGSTLSRIADTIASPGELLCFATIGGAFSGCPRTIPGYTVWYVGVVLFWFLLLLAAGSLFRVLHRRFGRGRS